MDLRQVDYVLAIVEHGGFTRAAEALHIAQPSLSQSIRRLEAELGAPLFVRLGRQVRLSAAGEAFVGPARRLLRDASTLREAVAAHTTMATGTLDIVALPTLVADPLATLIGAYRSTHPGIMIRVDEPRSSQDLIDMIRDGRSEIGITESAEPVTGLTQMQLSRQRLLAVLPPGTDAGADDTRLDLRRLARQPMILGPIGTSTRDLVDVALAEVDAVATVAVETSQREAIVPLVVAGAGVSVLPEPMAREAQRQGALVRRLRPELWRAVALVHPTDGLSPAAEAFIRTARIQPIRRSG